MFVKKMVECVLSFVHIRVKKCPRSSSEVLWGGASIFLCSGMLIMIPIGLLVNWNPVWESQRGQVNVCTVLSAITVISLAFLWAIAMSQLTRLDGLLALLICGLALVLPHSVLSVWWNTAYLLAATVPLIVLGMSLCYVSTLIPEPHEDPG